MSAWPVCQSGRANLSSLICHCFSPHTCIQCTKISFTSCHRPCSVSLPVFVHSPLNVLCSANSSHASGLGWKITSSRKSFDSHPKSGVNTNFGCFHNVPCPHHNVGHTILQLPAVWSDSLLGRKFLAGISQVLFTSIQYSGVTHRKPSMNIFFLVFQERYRLASNSLYSWGWPWTPNPASTIHVLGLELWVTTHRH